MTIKMYIVKVLTIASLIGIGMVCEYQIFSKRIINHQAETITALNLKVENAIKTNEACMERD